MLNQLKAEKCRRSFYYFIKEFWEVTDPSNFTDNWHIEFLCNEMEKVAYNLLNNIDKENDIIVNCPPGVSKSMIISVMFPAWLFIKNPKIKIISASYSSTIALELSTKSRNLIQTEKYKQYFNIDLKDDENTKGLYKTNKGGYRFTTSTGSNILGAHADIIICDDLQNLKGTYSETDRNNVYSWVSGTLSTRKTDKKNSVMIFVQQRLHQLDLTNYLLSTGNKYNHIILPGILTDKLQPSFLKDKYINDLFDVNRLDLKSLEILKNDLGTKNFNSQILQNPENDDDSIIKREWINIIDYSTINSFINDKTEYIYFIDTAYGGKDADYNVILECFENNNQLYITNVIRNKEEFPQLIETIKKISHKGKKIYIEEKASGKSIIQQLKSNTNYIIKELNPGKDNKIIRLNAISPVVESRRVNIVNANWNKEFLDEITSNYPKNDDMRDVFCYSINQLLQTKKYHRYV